MDENLAPVTFGFRRQEFGARQAGTKLCCDLQLRQARSLAGRPQRFQQASIPP